MRDNVIVQFAVLVLAVTAGQLLLKMGASYLPQSGFLGAVRTVVGSL
jgi:hypothetical protein